MFKGDNIESNDSFLLCKVRGGREILRICSQIHSNRKKESCTRCNSEFINGIESKVALRRERSACSGHLFCKYLHGDSLQAATLTVLCGDVNPPSFPNCRT